VIKGVVDASIKTSVSNVVFNILEKYNLEIPQIYANVWKIILKLTSQTQNQFVMVILLINYNFKKNNNFFKTQKIY
jgi:hypothetical protein